MPTRLRHLLAAGTAGFALVLTGCGDSDDSASPAAPSSTTATFNDADVSFAQDMIPHHRQAVAMARLASTRASDPEVKRLAAGIEDAQGPEIAEMTGWLSDWNQEVPDDMSGMDRSSSMPGMMSTADMTALGKQRGEAFDQRFLTMMVAHHQGAIEMARTEQTAGKSTDAVSLAQQIEAAQTEEVTTMKDLAS